MQGIGIDLLHHAIIDDLRGYLPIRIPLLHQLRLASKSLEPRQCVLYVRNLVGPIEDCPDVLQYLLGVSGVDLLGVACGDAIGAIEEQGWEHWHIVCWLNP